MALHTDNTLRVSVIGTSSGQAIINVLHYRVDTGATGIVIATPAAILLLVQSAWRSKVTPQLSDSYTAQEYRLVAVTGTTEKLKDDGTSFSPKQWREQLGEAAVRPGAGPGDTGGKLGASLPTFTTATVRKLTGLAGRENRGRLAVGPLPEVYTEATFQNRLTATALAGLQDTESFVISSIDLGNGETLVPILFHRTRMLRTSFASGQPLTSTAGFRTTVTGAATNHLVGSQTSRKERFRLGA